MLLKHLLLFITIYGGVCKLILANSIELEDGKGYTWVLYAAVEKFTWWSSYGAGERPGGNACKQQTLQSEKLLGKYMIC